MNNSKNIALRAMGTVADFLHKHPVIKNTLHALPDGTPERRLFADYIERAHSDWNGTDCLRIELPDLHSTQSKRG